MSTLKSMVKPGSAVLATFILMSGAAAVAESEGPFQRLRKSFQKVPISGKADTELGSDNLGLEFGVQGKVSAAQGGGYVRSTTWSVAPAIKASHSNVSVRARNQVEIEFVRLFSDRASALTATPYRRQDIPNDAASAVRSKLKAGEYVRYSSKLRLSVGPSVGHDLGFSKFKVGASYNLQGEFVVELLRLRDNNFRLSVSRVRTKSKELEMKLSALDVGGGVIADRVFGGNLMKAKTGTNRGELVAFEYVYNLNDRAAQEAFDDALVGLRNVVQSGINVTKSSAAATKTDAVVTARFAESDRLYENNPGRSPVQREIMAQVQFEGTSQSLDINLGLMKFSAESQSVQQALQIMDSSGKWNYYFLSHYGGGREFSIKGLTKSQQDFQTNILFNATTKSVPTEFTELNMRYTGEGTNRRMTSKSALSAKLRLMLPEQVHQSVVGAYLGQLPDFNGGVETEIDIVVHKNGLEKISNLSDQAIEQVLLQYLANIEADESYESFNVQANPSGLALTEDGYRISAKNVDERIRTHVRVVLPKLVQALRGNSVNARWNAYTQLQMNELYQKIGAGILTRLVYAACPGQDYSECMGVGVRRRDSKNVRFDDLIGQGRPSEQVVRLIEYRDQALDNKYRP